MQQRTGKTLTFFLALARLWLKGVRRVVVICPKSAVGVWRRQARLHLKIPYAFFDGQSLAAEPHPKALQILCINFERTWRTNGWELINQFKPDVFIVDEIHRIASKSSRQSYATFELGQQCAYRWGGTGTPTEEDEIDFFGEFRFIDPDLLGRDWKTFERRWCRKSGFGNYGRRIKKHKRKELLRLVKPYVFTITRDEALHLPPEENYVVPVKLTGECAKAYRKIEEELKLEIQDEVIVTPMRMTQMIKLQQLTGGFLLTEESRIRFEQDKLATLVDWIQDYPRRKKIVVFARFTEEIEALRHTLTNLGRTVGVLHGKTKDRTIWEDFQDRKDPAILLCQAQTGGEAIELSVGDIGVFYSKLWSWRSYDQCRARLLGRKKVVEFVSFEAEGTIDEDISHVLDRKGGSARAILSALKNRRTIRG